MNRLVMLDLTAKGTYMRTIWITLTLMFVLSACAFATVPDNPYTATFTCTGSQGPFPFTFPISDPTSLTVILNGSVVPSNGYTLTSVNNNYNNGGNVTLGGSYPCTSGYHIVLTRITSITQATQFYNNMPALPVITGSGLDKATEIMQEIWGRTVHSIQLQNAGVNYLLPASGGDVILNFANCPVTGTQTGSTPEQESAYTITCPTSGGGGGGSAAGPLNAVQYNYPLGTFSGDSGLQYVAATQTLSGVTESLSTLLTVPDLRTANFPVMDVRDYGIKSDGTQLTTCSITATQATVHCTSSSFVSTDATKGAFFLGAGAASGYLNTTIASVQDANDITLSSPAITSSSSLFFYGTDNTTAWCTMMNCNSSTVPNSLYSPQPGRRVFAPRGAYFFTNSIDTRNGDQLVGADQTATEFLIFSNTNSKELLYLGAYNNSGTWTLDSGGLENNVRGIIFTTPENNTQVCVETLAYSGFNIDHNWFECGYGIQTEGNIGSIIDNTFDSNNWTGINIVGTGGNDFADSTHSLIIQNNKFFAQRLNAVDINGSGGIGIYGNDFNYSHNNGILVTSSSGYTTYRLKVIGNNFVTSTSSAYYNCTGNYAIQTGSPLADSVISGNTFAMSHSYDIADSSGAWSHVSITGNNFTGKCASGVCTNSCSGQTGGTGQQENAIDIEVAGTDVTIDDNHFNSPGGYAVRSLGPVLLSNNVCSNPFTVTPPSAGDQFNGCFSFLNSTASGTIATNNTTDSTTSAAVVTSGSPIISSSGNRSGWTYDVVMSGGADNSWNEVAELLNSATVPASLNPRNGNAVVNNITVSSQATAGVQCAEFTTSGALQGTGAVCNSGSGGGGTVTTINATGPITVTPNPITATGSIGFITGDVASSGNVVATHLVSPLPVTQGGTGSVAPSLVAGTGINITGTWPNQTVTNTGGGGGGTVNVNGSAVSNPNFNGTTPPAQTNYANNVYQVSGSNVSSETPGIFLQNGSTPFATMVPGATLSAYGCSFGGSGLALTFTCSGGGGGSPGGTTNDVQINESSSFSADSGYYQENPSTHVMNVGQVTGANTEMSPTSFNCFQSDGITPCIPQWIGGLGSQSLPSTGQTGWAEQLDYFLHAGLQGVDNGPGAKWLQTVGGTSNAITATAGWAGLSPTINDKMTFQFTPTANNAAGSVSITIDGVLYGLVGYNGIAASANMLVANSPATIVYNGNTGNMQMATGGGIGGSGTNLYLAVWNGATTLQASHAQDTGSVFLLGEPFTMGTTTYSAMIGGTLGNGTIVYCSNCDAPTVSGTYNTCTSSSGMAGAEAHKIRGTWQCF